jgi:hypothetical protein
VGIENETIQSVVLASSEIQSPPRFNCRATPKRSLSQANWSLKSSSPLGNQDLAGLDQPSMAGFKTKHSIARSASPSKIRNVLIDFGIETTRG